MEENKKVDVLFDDCKRRFIRDSEQRRNIKMKEKNILCKEHSMVLSCTFKPTTTAHTCQ